MFVLNVAVVALFCGKVKKKKKSEICREVIFLLPFSLPFPQTEYGALYASLFCLQLTTTFEVCFWLCLFFYIPPFSGLKLSHVITSVFVAISLLSSATPSLNLLIWQEIDPVSILFKEGLQKLIPCEILENLLEDRLRRCPNHSFGWRRGL